MIRDQYADSMGSDMEEESAHHPDFYARHNGHRIAPNILSGAAHPCDEIEPDADSNEFRSAALKFALVLNRAMIFIVSSANQQLASWQVAYAVGLPVCEGVSMTERAAKLGLTRAAFSKGAKAFARGAGIKGSEYFKDESSTASYANARKRQLQNQ